MTEKDEKVVGYLRDLVTQDRRRKELLKNPNVTGLLVCCPSYGGHVSQQTAGLLYMIAQFCATVGIKSQVMLLAFSDIVDVRNIQITKFYDEYDFSHCLMIDNDMGADISLIQAMLELDVPLVGTLYSRREMPTDGNPMSTLIGHLYPDEKWECRPPFIKVRHVGAGILMFNRELVSKMLQKFPDINDLDDPGRMATLGVTRIIRAFEKMKGPEGNRLSEDYSFCERWQQCGGEVWANFCQPVSHVGPFDFCSRYSDVIKIEQKTEAASEVA